MITLSKQEVTEKEFLVDACNLIHDLQINWSDYPKYSSEGYQTLCRIETYLRNQIFELLNG
jgi:hypothetical protein